MTIPTLPGFLETLTSDTFAESFPFLLNSQPRDFTNSTITAGLKGKVAGQVHQVDCTDYLQVDTNIVTLHVPPEVKPPPGIYTMTISEHRADTVIETLIRFKLKISEGPEA